MEPKVIDLYEFLVEAELQHYYNCIKNELKITTVAHLKYATDEDFKQIGLSRPEIRRMRKYYEKYFPHGYLSKIKRLLQNPTNKKDEIITTQTNPILAESSKTSSSSPTRIPNNKHIIPADSICVNKQLGIGEFGIVQQGVWTNGTERIQVAIKCLCRERMISNPMDFLKEAAIMHSIEHENIVRLYGVVLDTDSLMLVTELAPLRSLLECLKDSSLRVNFLTVPTLCEFAMQICNGMMYLEAKRLIHRDLAARNILVFSKNKVKISDFGLSRALGAGKDYYTIKFSPALKLPMAWCAPECISFLRFTSASDVWAYGVCLWEMFSYGFQPWAALTGLQILEAIDSPSCQRLEQPDCCPKEYYTLMLKCWAHIPEKRPKFNEMYTMLPDIKPEQLKTIVACSEIKKDHMMYRQGEIITVLDKTNNSPLWKGVLNSGKTGLFNPANTVAYLEGLPSSNNRDSFQRTLDRSSKRKLRTEMISKPQNDLKHTGHVGLDGAYFGDVSFLSTTSSNYNHLPRQIVTPYKPSEDLEQTPLLLPPTPTSPDSTQTASGYFSESTNPSFVHSIESTLNTTMSTTVGDTTPKHHQTDGFGSCFNFNNIPSPTLNYPGSNPFINHEDNSNTFNSNNDQFKSFVDDLEDVAHHNNKDHKIDTSKWPLGTNDQTSEGSHEYHEISDDEVQAEKIFDGPSLLDEMDYMFRSMSATTNSHAIASNQISLQHQQQQQPPQSPDFDHTNKRNEITELASKLQRKNSSDTSYTSGTNKSCKKNNKSGSSIKQISHKDEKILNHAIEIANEISARSMTDLFSSETSQQLSLQSPKRKFSFKFPHLTGVTSSSSGGDKDSNGSTVGSGTNSNSNTLTNSKERKNFSEELKNVSDLQRFRSLTEIEKHPNSDIIIPLFDKESSDFCFEKSRELLSKPFNLDLPSSFNPKNFDKKTRDLIGENLLEIENTLKALNLDFLQTYNDLEKTDSAETLFGGESYTSYENSPKIQNPKLTKLFDLTFESTKQANGLGGIIVPNTTSQSTNTTKTGVDTAIVTTNLTKNPKLKTSNEFFIDIPRKLDSTPESNFSPKELISSSSRRSSGQKSNYSPQETNFSPRDITTTFQLKHDYRNEISPISRNSNSSPPVRNVLISSNNSIHSSALHSLYNNSSRCLDSPTSRQRSLSFTENYELKSPVLSEPQRIKSKAKSVDKSRFDNEMNEFTKTRNVIVYKPKSIRARNLRRLSYNPIILDSSSSSSSETEFDRSIAHSECDIRSKMSTSRRKRQNRKSTQSQDKLYGSNASIKSAPQYNYAADRNPNYTIQPPQFTEIPNIYSFDAQNLPTNRAAAVTAAAAATIIKSGNYDRNTSGKISYHLKDPMIAFDRELLYSEFDVTKLTGKSPTTHSYLNQFQGQPTPLSVPSAAVVVAGAIKTQAPLSAPPVNTQKEPAAGFRWPEKIHASEIKQNNLIWRRGGSHGSGGGLRPPATRKFGSQQTIYTDRLNYKHNFSSDSSSTETDSIDFHRDFIPRMPPSPAP